MFKLVNDNLHETEKVRTGLGFAARMLKAPGMGSLGISNFYHQYGNSPGFTVQENNLPVPHQVNRVYQLQPGFTVGSLQSIDGFTLQSEPRIAQNGQAWLVNNQIYLMGDRGQSFPITTNAIALTTVPVAVNQIHAIDVSAWNIADVSQITDVLQIESGGMVFTPSGSPTAGNFEFDGDRILIYGYANNPLVVGATLNLTVEAELGSVNDDWVAVTYLIPSSYGFIDVVEHLGIVFVKNTAGEPRPGQFFTHSSILTLFMGTDLASAIAADPFSTVLYNLVPSQYPNNAYS